MTCPKRQPRLAVVHHDTQHSRMKLSLVPLLAVTALATLPACSWFHRNGTADDDAAAKKKKEDAKSQLVGRIASISSDKKFVLIQSYGSWEVPVGSVLTTEGGENRTSNLRNTGEKLGQFAAADIQAGLPLVGDAVFSASAPIPKSAPAVPEKPHAPENIPALPPPPASN